MIYFRYLCRRVLSIFLTAISFPFNKELNLYGSGFSSFGGHVKYQFLSDTEEKVWISKSIQEYDQLTSLGLPVVKLYSLRYWCCLFKAKTAFISHNVSDVSPTKPSYLKVINLWHGHAIKYIGFDSKVELQWLGARISYGVPLPYEEWDEFRAQSSAHARLIKSAMRLSDRQVKVSEPASQRWLRSNWRSGSKITGRTKILYVPTFRNDGSDDKVVRESISLIRKRFSKESYDIYMRLHPLVKCEINGLDCSIRVDNSEDVFESMSDVDILISDYSSIIYDFSVTGGQIYLIRFLDEQYKSLVGGLYEVCCDVTGYLE